MMDDVISMIDPTDSIDEDIFLVRREISQQTSINGVDGLAGAFFLF